MEQQLIREEQGEEHPEEGAERLRAIQGDEAEEAGSLRGTEDAGCCKGKLIEAQPAEGSGVVCVSGWANDRHKWQGRARVRASYGTLRYHQRVFAYSLSFRSGIP